VRTAAVSQSRLKTSTRRMPRSILHAKGTISSCSLPKVHGRQETRVKSAEELGGASPPHSWESARRLTWLWALSSGPCASAFLRSADVSRRRDEDGCTRPKKPSNDMSQNFGRRMTSSELEPAAA